MSIMAQTATECMSDAYYIGNAITTVALIIAGAFVVVVLIKELF